MTKADKAHPVIPYRRNYRTHAAGHPSYSFDLLCTGWCEQEEQSLGIHPLRKWLDMIAQKWLV